jgi:hypothetical protein
MPLCIIYLGELHARNAAGIVDKYMDSAESLHCLRDQSLDVRQPLNIARHRQQLSAGLSRYPFARLSKDMSCPTISEHENQADK